MLMKPYEWQKRFQRIYKGTGIIKAFAGTGKTYATILLLKERGYKNPIIAVPTRKLKNQWLEELTKHGVKNFLVETFQILSKDKSNGLKCGILIVDECHRSVSPVFKRLYDNINYNHILGLSATPNKACLDYCGNIVIEVPLSEAQISDFIVYFHGIDLNLIEREQYDKQSEAIGRYLSLIRRTYNDNEKWSLRKKLDSMVFKRRSIVYSADSRIPKAVNLIKKNSSKPTLVICKRIEQANILSKITGYPAYHSEKPDEKALNAFQHDKIPVLLSVGMLHEGYDKQNIKCLIIVSSAITEAYHIQSIGRAVRLPDDAEIHILLARRTTDEKLLQFRHMYKHELVGSFSRQALRPKNPWRDQYFLADEYSIDTEGKIYQKTSEGKQYFKENPINYSLQRLLNYRAGKFHVTRDNLVLAKIGGKIVPLGILQEPLDKIKPKKLKQIN